MTPASRSQLISGCVALANYLMAAAWPNDAQQAVQYAAGALVAAITGWKAPSAAAAVVLRNRPKNPRKTKKTAFETLPHMPRGLAE